MSFQFFDFLDLADTSSGQPSAGLFPGWTPPKPGETKAKAAAAKTAANQIKIQEMLLKDFRRLADSYRQRADELYQRASTADRRTVKKVSFLLPKIKEARMWEDFHGLYQAVAVGLEHKTLPEGMRGIKLANTIDWIRTLNKWPELASSDKRLRNEGLHPLNFYPARDFVVAKFAPAPDRDMNRYRVLEMELNLVGTPIQSFFPTPVALAESMVRDAGIEAGHRVLEPSAGSGRIADAIRNLDLDITLHVLELNWELKELLAAKGFAVKHADFLNHTEFYDRILLNPPFEKFADVAHVQHAFSLLNQGGRLVAIMGDSAFIGITSKAVAFQNWLQQVGADWWQLPANTFNQGDRPTKVNTRMVVIDKR